MTSRIFDTCSQLLAGVGLDCVTADAAHAISLIDSATPNLALTNVNLPAEDGFLVANCAQRRIPPIPVIVITGYRTKETERRARAVGAGEFLAKAVSNITLLEAVRRALSGI